ncbi:hypothetical protein ASC77_18590 [Nocardioides sp. Root1257]|nr:hypothetical protein ASC77_18590 [Nocardioides sp. Root1257]KRC43189.1 hypothetical protein ASE24_19555 [Nocardioides sp. Root224]
MGTASRAEIARSTELAFSTVSAAVSTLQSQGLVDEVAVAPSGLTMGRPSMLLSLNRRAGLVGGVEIGKQHLHVVLAGLSHAVISESRRPVQPDLPADEGAALVGATVSDLLEEVGADRSELLGVGLGLPGPIREPNGEVGDSSILPGWVGVGVAELVSAELQVPVMVDNDANLGALAEWMWGAGRGCQDMVFLKVATGIGAGLIVSGSPYRGTGGTAGEIGHTQVNAHGQLCRCGNRGCLETVAGSHALVQAFSETRERTPSLEQVIEWALSGDVGSRRVIGDAGRAIGSAMAMFCNVLNPARIVVGGELAAAGTYLIQPLREVLERNAIASAAADVEVVVGELGDRAVALGAVGLVLRSTTIELPEASRSEARLG